MAAILHLNLAGADGRRMVLAVGADGSARLDRYGDEVHGGRYPGWKGWRGYWPISAGLALRILRSKAAVVAMRQEAAWRAWEVASVIANGPTGSAIFSREASEVFSAHAAHPAAGLGL